MKPVKRPHGSLRRSQVLTTYGPGAMVDLPTRSVLIGGLESWSEGGRTPVHEPRLTDRLARELGVPGLRLATPPGDAGDPNQPFTGITGWIFPEWFVGPYDAPEDGPPADGSRRRALVHREKLVDGKYQKKDVVPIRFVQACVNGHIDDIPWYLFVHGPDDPCRRQLWVVERGTTSDLANVTIRCDCGRARSMATAEFRGKREAEGDERDKAPLGYCRGRRPWLGPRSQEACRDEHGEVVVNRLLIRSASNAWFSDTAAVISIPDADGPLLAAVEQLWATLTGCASLDDLRVLVRIAAPVRDALAAWPVERVWEAIERKRLPVPPPDKGLKEAELEMLLDSRDELGVDKPEGDFFARRRSLGAEFPYKAQIARVVLVHRLREVMALLGFTRFEAPVADEDGELGLGVRRAALAKDLTWLPAIENRGEGIFLEFDRAAVEAWAARPAVEARWQVLAAGQDRWKKRHPNRGHLPGLPYLLLHSFSHLLMTSVALDCGYASTSIRERIYAIPDVGYGILLYTATSDAEGTLGGLVQVGRRIEDHIALALERGRLCSHDPVCAQHDPRSVEERYLHGAACHACVLVSETSCEQRNELLDRALVVPTVESGDAAFFGAP